MKFGIFIAKFFYVVAEFDILVENAVNDFYGNFTVLFFDRCFK